MNKFFIIAVLLNIFIITSFTKASTADPRSPSTNFMSINTENQIIGNSLPGTWRPFSDSSLWNTPIAKDAKKHPESDKIMATLLSEAQNLRLVNTYAPPVWVINSDYMPKVKVHSTKIIETWDKDHDDWVDDPIPLKKGMWGEPTGDGHIIIIDPFKNLVWEMSHYEGLTSGYLEIVEKGETPIPLCTTFNIWDLTGSGQGDPYFHGYHWQTIGGRGSGFPLIAGLLRPEELKTGHIRHALVFSFPKNRVLPDGSKLFLPPASRSDGKVQGDQYPIEGMRFQLDPALTKEDFVGWGLTKEGQVLARALQEYGMFLGDNGGMSICPQLLGPSKEENRKKWDELFPGFYETVMKIPTRHLSIIYTGEPISKK